MNVWLWASGQGNKKAIRYVYDMSDPRGYSNFFTTSDRMNDGKIDIRYAMVWVPDINASINFFESNPGGSWNYSIHGKNCKHYEVWDNEFEVCQFRFYTGKCMWEEAEK